MPKRNSIKKLPKVVLKPDSPGLTTATEGETPTGKVVPVLRNLKRAHAARQRTGI